MRLARTLLKTASAAGSSISTLNPTHRFIRDRIRSGGPITVHEYMRLSIGSKAGYYSNKKDIFGAKGDFITAPEVSQVFGELISVWIVNALRVSKFSGEWQLVELAPGSGVLMHDMLGALHKLKASIGSAHLVETSETLSAKQRQLLCNGEDSSSTSSTKVGVPIFWHDSIGQVPTKKFSVFVANEFFDALPIHQFQRNDQGEWCEVYVNLKDDRLCFMLSNGENIHTRNLIPEKIRSDVNLLQWEFCLSAATQLIQIATRINAHGGFALYIDYGHLGDRASPSLRAYLNHEVVDPLEAPGQIDITADVNFGHLRDILHDKCTLLGPVDQRSFLLEMGISLRLEYFLKRCRSKRERDYVMSSANMLLGSDEQGGMGTRFKAMAAFPAGSTLKYEQKIGFLSSELPQSVDELDV